MEAIPVYVKYMKLLQRKRLLRYLFEKSKRTLALAITAHFKWTIYNGVIYYCKLSPRYRAGNTAELSPFGSEAGNDKLHIRWLVRF